jgi:hypothetical protein
MFVRMMHAGAWRRAKRVCGNPERGLLVEENFPDSRPEVERVILPKEQHVRQTEAGGPDDRERLVSTGETGSALADSIGSTETPRPNWCPPRMSPSALGVSTAPRQRVYVLSLNASPLSISDMEAAPSQLCLALSYSDDSRNLRRKGHPHHCMHYVSVSHIHHCV